MIQRKPANAVGRRQALLERDSTVREGLDAHAGQARARTDDVGSFDGVDHVAAEAHQQAGFIYIIKQLELGLRPRLFDACASSGLTGAQYTALTVLNRRAGITGAELARRSFVRAQTMSSTLQPLLDAGLVRREHDDADHRRIRLYITEKGSEAIAELDPRVMDIEELLVSQLSKRERRQFAEYLRKCRSALDVAGHRNEE